jgi:hypothetical protein
MYSTVGGRSLREQLHYHTYHVFANMRARVTRVTRVTACVFLWLTSWLFPGPGS